MLNIVKEFGSCQLRQQILWQLTRSVPALCHPTRFLSNNISNPKKFNPQIGRLSQNFPHIKSYQEEIEGSDGEILVHLQRQANVERHQLDILAAEKNFLSPEEWTKLKDDALLNGWATIYNFEGMMMGRCTANMNYTLGKSLYDWVRQSGRNPNVVTLSKFLKLSGLNFELAGDDLIREVYGIIVRDFGPDFDATTCEDLICGLSKSSLWKDAQKYFDMIKVTCLPTSLAYSALAMSSLSKGEIDNAKSILAECTQNRGRSPSDEVYIEWMNACDSMRGAREAEAKELFTDMLSYMKQNEILLKVPVTLRLQGWLEGGFGGNWKSDMNVRIKENGICNNCGEKLENITLAEADYKLLRDNFLPMVIEGKDIYYKSNPIEIQRFKDFVAKTAPFDVVIDGPNVAYAGLVGSERKTTGINQHTLAKNLQDVVRHFAVEQNMKVLLLGKHHMKRWPHVVMDKIRSKTPCYFTENVSKDDPFLLYAALASGQGTLFASRDVMRDHESCLDQGNYRQSHPHEPHLGVNLGRLFRRWARRHQLTYICNDKAYGPKFKKPILYNPVAQWTEHSMHIPYDGDLNRFSHEIPTTWLCVKRSDKESTRKRITVLGTDVKSLFN